MTVQGKIGLVTVLYKSNEVLDGFFKSLSRQTHKYYQLYIIDNSPSESTDILIAKLVEQYSITQFLHIKCESNSGVAAGNNTGIRLALWDNCEYVLLLNNDIEFEQPDLLSQMLREAQKNTQLLVVPKILFYDTRKIWMAGGKFVLWKALSVHVGEGEEDHGQYDSQRIFDYAPTCFMLIHRSVFETVGLMDEKYFVGHDDTDFVYRANQYNCKVLYLPHFIVLHKANSSTGGKESLFNIYYGNRNRIYFIRKHIKGFLGLIAYTYTYITRIIRYAFYDKERRAKCLQGLRDGVKMSL